MNSVRLIIGLIRISSTTNRSIKSVRRVISSLIKVLGNNSSRTNDRLNKRELFKGMIGIIVMTMEKMIMMVMEMMTEEGKALIQI
jgi:hypothetical protein